MKNNYESYSSDAGSDTQEANTLQIIEETIHVEITRSEAENQQIGQS